MNIFGVNRQKKNQFWINIFNLACTGLENWESNGNAVLYGEALDQDGNVVITWNTYEDLYSAQVVCIGLGTGCGGVTKQFGTYSIRQNTNFVSKDNAESWKKPAKPCNGK